MKTDNANPIMKKALNISIGILIGMAVTAVIMLVFSAIMLVFDVDRSFASPFATVSVAFGTLSSSAFAAAKIGDKGYLIGFAVGVIVFAIITAFSLILNPVGLGYNTLFHLIIIILSSIIGGILGVNAGKSKKYI